MRTPQQFVDPSLPVDPNNLGFLTPQERAALGNDVPPEQTVQEYQQNRQQQQDWVDRVELDRIQQENQKMREQLGQTTQQLNQYAQTTSNLQGQLTQLTNAQLQAQQQAELQSRYAWSEDEMQAHGDLRPLIEREAQRLMAETENRLRQEYEQRLAEATQQSTAPLQEKLQMTEQRLEAQRQYQAQRFNMEFAQKVADLGLPSIAEITKMPEFTARFSQPFAPGSTVAWGDQLKQNITDQNLHGAVEMLRDFRDNNTNFRPSEESPVPARNNPRQSNPSAAQNQNLTKREQLTALYTRRQEEFTQGILPAGWDRAKYRFEQQKLRDQIDAIPTT